MDRSTLPPSDRVVIALGGNALLRVGEEDTFQNAYRAARRAAERVLSQPMTLTVLGPFSKGAVA